MSNFIHTNNSNKLNVVKWKMQYVTSFDFFQLPNFDDDHDKLGSETGPCG